MSKKSLGEYLVETGMDYIFMFVGMCILCIPMAIMTGGVESAAGLIFIVIIFALCLLSGNSSETKKTNSNTAKKEVTTSYEERLTTCPHCGNYVSKTVKKCPYCNHKLSPRKNIFNWKKDKQDRISVEYIDYTPVTYQNNDIENKDVKNNASLHPSLKICPNCDAAMKKKLKKCPYCGYRF